MKNNKKMGITVREIIYIALSIFILGTILTIFKTENTESNIEISEEIQNNIVLKEMPIEVAEETDRDITSSKVMSRSSTTRTSRDVETTKIEYTKLEDISISRDMDLTVTTGISKEDFKKLMTNLRQDSSNFFEQNSDLIYDLCQEYELNEIFFCGLISAESGWNIASNHRRTYNYISLMYNGKLIQYSSVEEGLTVAAQKLHNNYLTPGGSFYYGKTLSAVKTKFCPASSTWVNLVYGRMQQIMSNI